MVLRPFWSEDGYTLCPFWSEIGNGMDSGLKTGVENDSFWYEIESGFAEPGGTPP